jgi:hypothetical protein
MKNHAAHNQRADVGLAWLAHREGRQDAIILIQKGVAGFLKNLSKQGYLDQQAGVHLSSLSTPTHEKEDCHNEQNDPHVIDGHHGTVQPSMELQDTNKKDASSIVVWDYPLSPAFVEYATTVGLEDVLFMNDPNSKQSGRLLRVESVDVGPSRDILFQVGSDNTGVAHKARAMSALGRMFLQIANFLSRKVHGFIWGELVHLYGEKQADIWTPRLAVYDLINHQVSTKPGAVYDWHHDANGCSATTRRKTGNNFSYVFPHL